MCIKKCSSSCKVEMQIKSMTFHLTPMALENSKRIEMRSRDKIDNDKTLCSGIVAFKIVISLCYSIVLQIVKLITIIYNYL